MTHPQKRYIKGLLKGLQLENKEEELVLMISGKRTKELSDLNKKEISSLIEHLCILKEGDRKRYKSKIRMKQKVYCIANEHPYFLDANGDFSQEKLNGFMLTRSVYKKPINQYSHEELVELVSQFDKMSQKV